MTLNDAFVEGGRNGISTFSGKKGNKKCSKSFTNVVEIFGVDEWSKATHQSPTTKSEEKQRSQKRTNFSKRKLYNIVKFDPLGFCGYILSQDVVYIHILISWSVKNCLVWLVMVKHSNLLLQHFLQHALQLLFAELFLHAWTLFCATGIVFVVRTRFWCVPW